VISVECGAHVGKHFMQYIDVKTEGNKSKVWWHCILHILHSFYALLLLIIGS